MDLSQQCLFARGQHVYLKTCPQVSLGRRMHLVEFGPARAFGNWAQYVLPFSIIIGSGSIFSVVMLMTI